MTVDELLRSVENDSTPPDGLSPELESLWHTKADNWEAAHNIAQEIHTPMGSWIHAHLHVIEGDLGNAAYWYRKADRPTPTPPDGLDDEWRELVDAALNM